MNIPIYQIDTFASELFKGNPAAVCPLQQWIPDALMQSIAFEINLSETAFIVPQGTDYGIRWFTPGTEVALCGHATLASAWVVFQYLNYHDHEITFHSKSGPLQVTIYKNTRLLTLNFPANQPQPIPAMPESIYKGLGIASSCPAFKTSFDYMVVLPSQGAIEALQPDFKTLSQFSSCRGIIATAKGKNVDFVSRCFYPQSGIDEDPVTGSAHTIMAPYWANQLNKTTMIAHQLSQRGGQLAIEYKGDRVFMSGHTITFMKGEIEL
jgi:PhzF family phenazine biosynthesis protein